MITDQATSDFGALSMTKKTPIGAYLSQPDRLAAQMASSALMINDDHIPCFELLSQISENEPLDA